MVAKRKPVEKKAPFGYGEEIPDLDMKDELEDAFNVYAAKANFDRAFPAIEDGLKPVHRRVVYGLDTENIRPGKLTKAAKAVAVVMGDYHPHGDASIYGTIVNMEQDFKMRVPLIHGQGGWGTINLPVASAMRYPECSLTEEATVLAGLHVWSDSKKSEVREGFLPTMKNYTGEKDEPIRLPALFPNLVINGYTGGLGVGVAGSLPPHDPTQTLDLALHLINSPNVRTSTALSKLPGPDIPTGCQVFDDNGGIESYMTTGEGSFIMRADYEVVTEGRKKYLVFTSVPYGVSPEDVVAGIESKVNDGSLPVDVSARNHTSKNVDVRVFCGKTDPETLAQALFYYGGKTKLQTRETVKNLVLVDNCRLEIVGVIDCLKAWLDHRRNCIRLRSEKRREDVLRRIEIVEGYIKMVPLAQQIVKLVQDSDSRSDAAAAMMAKWDFTELQADSILSMTISQLTKASNKDYAGELTKLNGTLDHLNDIINDYEVLQQVLTDEVRAVRKFLKGDRQSVLMEGNSAVSKPKISVADSAVTGSLAVTNDRWVRWVSRGDIKRDLGGDYVESVYRLDTSIPVVAVTSDGRGVTLDTLALSKEKKSGYTNLKMSLAKSLNAGESIVAVVPAPGESDLLLTTAQGGAKRLAHKGFETQKAGRVYDVVKLKDGDTVVSASAVSGDDFLMVSVSESGKLTAVPSDQVAAKAGRGTGTNPLMKLDSGDVVVSTFVVDKDSKDSLVYATESDHLARIYVPNLEVHNRNVKGTTVLRPSEGMARAVLVPQGEKVVCGDDTFTEFEVTDVPMGVKMTPKGMLSAVDSHVRLMTPVSPDLI